MSKPPKEGTPASGGEVADTSSDASAGPEVRVQKLKRSVISEEVAPASRAQPAKVEPAIQSSAESPEAARERLMRTDEADDGFGQMRFPGSETPDPKVKAEQSEPAPDAEPDLPQKLKAIEAENLSERQLRVARRIATLHQIPVDSDLEAVLRLRERGIDPSHRAAVGKILSAQGAKSQSAPAPHAPAIRPVGSENLPQTATPAAPLKPPLPSREALTEDRRAAEMQRIQRDIAARRKRRLALLFARLAFFVFLPTFVMGFYYFQMATPLYATHAQFQIQSADSGGGSSSMGGLLAGSSLATNTDSVVVQSYLESRDAMLRLDRDLGFKRTFQDPSVDPVRRLAPDATNEETYRLYSDMVRLSYDPTEGVIGLEVIAPDPELSQQFSLALIGYAEGQVDQLTSRVRQDQMQGAEQNYLNAEEKVLAAQQRVQELQQKLGVLDPVAEGSVVLQQVSQLEVQLSTKRLELGTLLANERPQRSRVEAIEGDIRRLEEMISQTREQLTRGTENRASLASISGELRIAESDLLTRQELLAAAAGQMEVARIEANKQVRYLSTSVTPIPPDEPTYPKAIQNTIVSFLIFSGIYLMMSLTASILREQVSS